MASPTTSGGGGGGGGGVPSNPRKFSEKIAMHKQREAQDTGEFDRIMQEVSALRGAAGSGNGSANGGGGGAAAGQPRQRQQQQQQRPSISVANHSPVRGVGGVGVGVGNLTSVPTILSVRSSPSSSQHQQQQHHQQQHHHHVGGPHVHPTRHLSPNFPSAVPRHGSLPNVNAATGMQQMTNVQSVLSNDGFPVLLSATGGGGGSGGAPATSNHAGVTPVPIPAASAAAPNVLTAGSVPSAVSPLTISSGPDIAALLRGVSPTAVEGIQAAGASNGGLPSMCGMGASPGGGGGGLRGSGGSGGHVSIRDSVGATGSAGPIRNRTRIDTSPYGDRYSQSGYHHLSPPDPSWRRVHSDSSLHQSAGSNIPPGAAGGGGGVAAPPGTPAHVVVNHNGVASPLRGASPTTARKVSADQAGHVMPMPSPPNSNAGEVQNMDQLSFLGLPDDSEMSDRNKPGSLPDLTNFHVNPEAAAAAAAAVAMQGNNPFDDEQGSPYSSNASPGETSPRSSNATSAPIAMAAPPEAADSHHQQQFSLGGAVAGGGNHFMGSSSAPANNMLPNLQQQQQQHYSHQPYFFGSATLSSLDQQYQQPRQQQQQQQQPQQRRPSWATSSPSPSSPHTPSSGGSTRQQPPPRQQQQQQHQTETELEQQQPPAVQLSDGQISEILSLPMDMITDGGGAAAADQQGLDNSASMPSSPSATSSTTTAVANSQSFFCDSPSSRNLLHMSKGLAIDQSGAQIFMYQQQVLSGQKPSNMELHTQYRSPQAIPNSHSPVSTVQGSPLGPRSASPVDGGTGMAGSPLGSTSSPLHSPSGVYDGMASGASAANTFNNMHKFGAGQQQNELSNEFQKFTMVEGGGGGGGGGGGPATAVFFQDDDNGSPSGSSGGNSGNGGETARQFNPNGGDPPINDLVGFLGNAMAVNGLPPTHQQQHQQQQQQLPVAPQTPQTPSSIPDIILTDADSSDQSFQRSLGDITFDASTASAVEDCLSQEIGLDGLGRLDDSMMKLLAADAEEDGVGGALDQHIADADTEEHLKS